MAQSQLSFKPLTYRYKLISATAELQFYMAPVYYI